MLQKPAKNLVSFVECGQEYLRGLHSLELLSGNPGAILGGNDGGDVVEVLFPATLQQEQLVEEGNFVQVV